MAGVSQPPPLGRKKQASVGDQGTVLVTGGDVQTSAVVGRAKLHPAQARTKTAAIRLQPGHG